jgi:hypothetical protein
LEGAPEGGMCRIRITLKLSMGIVGLEKWNKREAIARLILPRYVRIMGGIVEDMVYPKSIILTHITHNHYINPNNPKKPIPTPTTIKKSCNKN